MAIRVLAGGPILCRRAHRRGRPAPTCREWRSASEAGTLLLVGDAGLVAIAESIGVGSGPTATAGAAMPAQAAVWSGIFGRRPTGVEWAGLVIGPAGVVIPIGEGAFAGNPVGVTLVVVSPILWGSGSVWGGRIPMTPEHEAARGRMLATPPALPVGRLVPGERLEHAAAISGRLAPARLTLIGSVVATPPGPAFQTVRSRRSPRAIPARAHWSPSCSDHARREAPSGEAYAALPLILGGVGPIAVSPQRSRPWGTTPPSGEGGGGRTRLVLAYGTHSSRVVPTTTGRPFS